MSLYRFVGSECGLGDGTILSQFGQKVELDAEHAKELIARNVALLPEEVWGKTLITEDECAKFPQVILHSEATEDFLKKRNHAWKLLHQLRESLTSAPAGKEE